MTNIYIKGILGQKFGNHFKLNISNVMSALKGIDTNRSGFINELFMLNKKNINYFLICNGEKLINANELLERKKINTIYILPAIIGSGELFAAGIGLVAGTASFAVTSFLVNLVISTAVSLGVSFLMASLNKQASPPQQNIAVGGSASVIEARGRSYIFSNNANLTEQGSSIPVGYGQMKTASQVLLASIKSYSTNTIATNEFKSLENSSAFLDFLTD